MRMYDLSDDDLRRVVTDIFTPKKITNIRRNKRDDTLSCTIYTEWEDGEKSFDIADRVTFRNPFENSLYDAIDVDDGNFPIDSGDLKILKQFCFAKGIQPEYLTKDNPYLLEEIIEDPEEEKEL